MSPTSFRDSQAAELVEKPTLGSARGFLCIEDTNGSRAVEALVKALQDEEWRVKENVAKALRNIRDTRAVEPLIAALRDKHASVRSSVAATLGEIRDELCDSTFDGGAEG